MGQTDDQNVVLDLPGGRKLQLFPESQISVLRAGSGLQGILGIRREGAVLVVNSSIPAAWPKFEAKLKVGSTRYDIRLETLSDGGATSHAVFNRSPTPCGSC
jgi:hypothetical protein